MKRYAIIVASGKGERMNADLPKQFLPLKGNPVLFHSINAFRNFDPEIEIILVLPPGSLAFWEQLCKEYDYNFKGKITFGGASRTASVKNGLSLINENGIVAIHDGVRPLVDSATIERGFSGAQKSGNAAAVVRLKDSIRKVSSDRSESLDRDLFRLVQTPQTFKTELIIEAYQRSGNRDYSDDASVFEANGNKINMVEGDYRNIKITTPEDLLFAEAILTSQERHGIS